MQRLGSQQTQNVFGSGSACYGLGLGTANPSGPAIGVPGFAASLLNSSARIAAARRHAQILPHFMDVDFMIPKGKASSNDLTELKRLQTGFLDSVMTADRLIASGKNTSVNLQHIISQFEQIFHLKGRLTGDCRNISGLLLELISIIIYCKNDLAMAEQILVGCKSTFRKIDQLVHVSIEAKKTGDADLMEYACDIYSGHPMGWGADYCYHFIDIPTFRRRMSL